MRMKATMATTPSSGRRGNRGRMAPSGRFGLSYPGAVQWLAAVENPPHLKAMVPAMTFSTAQNFFYAGGLWDMSWMEWIWDNIAPDIRTKRNLPGPKTYDEASAAWTQVEPKMLNTLPLDQLEELRGIAPYYYEWLTHPFDDPWWDWCDLRNKYDRVHAAVLNFSGWYDDNYGPEGATTNFTGLLKARGGASDPQTHLLIGPWVHGVASTAKTKSGEREFGPAAAIDYDEVVLRWMDHYLRDAANGVEKEKPVRYFVMGDNQWREADAWPPASKAASYYLVSPKSGEFAGSLSADAPRAKKVVRIFCFRPGQTCRQFVSRLGCARLPRVGRTARCSDLRLRPAGAGHRSDRARSRHRSIWPATAAIPIYGYACSMWLQTARLSIVMSPGLDVLRASYRDLKKGRQLLTPNQVYELHLDNLITSNVFRKDHRIRVQISATFFPNFSRNLQSGDLEASSARMQKANISIYTDRSHPSRIILPGRYLADNASMNARTIDAETRRSPCFSETGLACCSCWPSLAWRSLPVARFPSGPSASPC